MNTTALFNIFNKAIDSSEVIEFLKLNSSFVVGKPDCGSQYVTSNDLGIDLLFEPDSGPQGGNTKNLRKCQTMFLYSEGKDGHSQYTGELPMGLKITDKRSELVGKLTPQRTWKIGEGEVDVNCLNPNHDRWDLDQYLLSAHYDKSGSTMYFVVKNKHA